MSKRIQMIIFVAAGILILFQTGCFVGTLTNVKATDLEYPVSFTDVLLDAQHTQVYAPGYEEVATFSFSYHQMGWASPMKIVRNRDISKTLNTIVRNNNGDGVVDLKISVADSPLNFLTLSMKMVAYFGAVIGVAMMVDKEADTLEGAAWFAGSAAAIIFLPGFSNVKIEGKVVKFK